MSDKPRIDLTGHKFGNLEILRMEWSTHLKINYWQAIYRCSICGNERRIKPADLKNGNKRNEDCGCQGKSRAKGKDSKKFTGYEEISGRYISSCKNRANTHNFSFNIDAKFLWELYLKQNRFCALSGVFINFNKGNIRGTASLDRIDSKKGYEEGNVQWVHKKVNLMKMYIPEYEFIEWCKKIKHNMDK